MDNWENCEPVNGASGAAFRQLLPALGGFCYGKLKAGIKETRNMATMEAIMIAIYVALSVYVLVMLWRLVHAVERIADKLGEG